MATVFAKFLQDRSGVTAIEYAVIVFFIAAILITVTHSLGERVAMTLTRALGVMIRHPALVP